MHWMKINLNINVIEFSFNCTLKMTFDFQKSIPSAHVSAHCGGRWSVCISDEKVIYIQPVWTLSLTYKTYFCVYLINFDGDF